MSFPISPVAKSITITGVSPTLVSVSHNLKRQARSKGSQRWLIDAIFAPMTRDEFAPIWAFVNKQQGQFNTFTYKPPIYKDTSGTATGALLANGAASAGDSSITCNGLTEGTLKAGDFIKFSGHDKVYTLTADSTTTLAIEPPLMKDVAHEDPIDYKDVAFTVAFSNDQQVMSVASNQLVGFSIKLVEVS